MLLATVFQDCEASSDPSASDLLLETEMETDEPEHLPATTATTVQLDEEDRDFYDQDGMEHVYCGQCSYF